VVAEAEVVKDVEEEDLDGTDQFMNQNILRIEMDHHLPLGTRATLHRRAEKHSVRQSIQVLIARIMINTALHGCRCSPSKRWAVR
jgi:hypothetical protein